MPTIKRIAPLLAAGCAGLALLAQLGAAPASAATPAVAELEVEHLLTYVEQSGCEFYRNGFWYTAHEGQDHLRTKYQYLANIDMVHTAENFIELAASKSSISGLAYEVRCGGGPAVPSAVWLGDELNRFRAPK